MTDQLDRVLLGVNPLVGVDHLSRERVRERSRRLNTTSVAGIIRTAFSSGATGINFAAGDPVITEALKALAEEGYDAIFGVYPMVPNTQSYIGAIAEKGIAGLAGDLLGGLSWTTKAKTLVQGGLSLMTSDPFRAMKVYLDIDVNRLLETLPQNARLRSILVHEIATDLVISLGAKELAETYVQHVKDHFHVKPGFVTRNLGKFVEFCEQCNFSLNDIVIMTPVNKLGFQMTPSKEECETYLLRKSEASVIGMSILAAGQIDLGEAIQYVKQFRSIKSLAVGVSSRAHAEETFRKLSSEFN